MLWTAFVMCIVFVAYALVAGHSNTGMVDGQSVDELLVMGFVVTAVALILSFTNTWCAQMLERQNQESK
jgi:hypothetical protein